MKELNNIRLRHAMLSSIQIHVTNYLQCMELGYFGKRKLEEKTLHKKLKTLSKDIDQLLWFYHDEEERLLT